MIHIQSYEVQDAKLQYIVTCINTMFDQMLYAKSGFEKQEWDPNFYLVIFLIFASL